MRFLLLLLFTLPAAAQEMPACTQDRVGGVACMAGKLCSCGYARGGVISGRPEGYRWDCGVLRPACGEALAPPAIPGMPQPMPPLFFQVPPGIGEPPGMPMLPPASMTPWPR